MLVHAHVWPQWEICIFGSTSCTVAEVASPHRDRSKVLLHIQCHFELGSIKLIQSFRHLLSGWQVDKKKDISSWFQQWMHHTCYHFSPRCIWKRRNHTFFLTSIFICAISTHSFLSLLFHSPVNYPQPCQEPCRMEGEKCVTLPLKFLIV